VFESIDGFFPAHKQGNDHMRKNDDIAKWEERQVEPVSSGFLT
jgi:hypothetical protein